MPAECADAVRLVDVHHSAVVLGKLEDGGQRAYLALHAVHALHNNEDAAPAGRLLHRSPQHPLHLCQVAVPGAADSGPRGAQARHQRRVVEVIREHEAALPGKRRQHQRVGSVAHRDHNSVLFANVLCNLPLEFALLCRHAHLAGCRGVDHAGMPDGVAHGWRCGLVGAAVAEVVVGAHVDAPLRGGVGNDPQNVHPVVPGPAARHHIDGLGGGTADGTVKTVGDGVVEPAGVELHETGDCGVHGVVGIVVFIVFFFFFLLGFVLLSQVGDCVDYSKFDVVADEVENVDSKAEKAVELHADDFVEVGDVKVGGNFLLGPNVFFG